MIVNHLSRIMGARRLKMSQVVRGAGISRSSLAEFYHAKAKRYDGPTLDRLCAYLEIQVGDLLEYVETEEIEQERAS